MTKKTAYILLLAAIILILFLFAPIRRPFIHLGAKTPAQANFGQFSATLKAPPGNPLTKLTIKFQIVEMIRSMALEYDVDPSLAIDLVGWESQLDPTAENPASSAKGLYQFLESTFKAHCKGVRENPYANAKCFMELWSAGEISHWTADPNIESRLRGRGYIE